MQISEIFDSIDGEGIRSGKLCTFIRVFGCNLRCSYCDTMYAVERDCAAEPPKDMDINDILSYVNRTYRRVTLTGGEPLLFPESVKLVRRLCDMDFDVNIETNGACDIVAFREMTGNKQNMFYTIDFKLPSSGAMYDMRISNFDNLCERDVLKLVIGSDEDLEVGKAFAQNIVEKYGDKAPHIYVGTVYGSYELSDVIEEFKKDPRLKDVVFQIQMHKVIWDPDRRGV